ncbi:MAG: roadblock/LC7 domain-containing protein [Candidatus Bathyarchaeota archaeon]
MSSIDLIKEVLSGLKKVGGITASAAVTRDGLLITSDIPEGSTDAETFAAMTATMVGAAETASIEVKAGEFSRVIVESSAGKLISLGAGSRALLVVLTAQKASLGLVLIKLKDAARKIDKIIG